MKLRTCLVIVIATGGVFVRPAIGVAEPFSHERRAALATDAWGGMRVDWDSWK